MSTATVISCDSSDAASAAATIEAILLESLEAKGGASAWFEWKQGSQIFFGYLY
jgi:hypothetical protein